VFGLGRGFDGVDLKWFKKKVGLFGLRYVIVDLWWKFLNFVDDVMVVCKFLIILKGVKCKFINLSLS